METVTDSIFLGSKISADGDYSHEIKRHLLLGKKAMKNLKKHRHYFANKGSSSQSYRFSSSHAWMWELDHKEGWALKNWYFWTVVLVKTLGSPLNGKEIKPVNPKRNQLWIFLGRTDTEAEAPILWPLMWRPDSLEKTLMLGKIKRKGERDDRRWDGWIASPIQ